MARSVVTALKALLLLALFLLPAYAAGKASTKPEPKAPTWQQLSPPQKQVLGELQSQWEQQPDRLRNNLVKVANKYPKMKPQEQERVRRRITRWASLTPEQRQAARERYKQIKKQPPEKQREVKKKWESYQSQRGQPTTDTPPYNGSNMQTIPAAPLKN
jgi:type I site-specific restriction-modification system R (restriction) subunit